MSPRASAEYAPREYVSCQSTRHHHPCRTRRTGRRAESDHRPSDAFTTRSSSHRAGAPRAVHRRPEQPILGRHRRPRQRPGQRSQRRFALTLRLQCVTALRPMSSGDRGLSSPGGWAARRSCFQPVRVTGRHSRCTRRRCKWHAGPDCRGHAPHCCSRIRMRGSFVDIAQRDPGIRTGGGDERVPECVRRYGLGDPVRVPAIERKPDVTRTSRLRHVTAQ